MVVTQQISATDMVGLCNCTKPKGTLYFSSYFTAKHVAPYNNIHVHII